MAQKYTESARGWISEFWSARADYFYWRKRSVVAYKAAEARMQTACNELEKLGELPSGRMPTLDEVDKANREVT